MEKTRILLVDDEPLLLDSLEIILSMNGMEIAGKAKDGNDALQCLDTVTCDLALVDLNMKGMGGIELIGKLREKYPVIKILVLTTFYDDDNITKAIEKLNTTMGKSGNIDKVLDKINNVSQKIFFCRNNRSLYFVKIIYKIRYFII